MAASAAAALAPLEAALVAIWEAALDDYTGAAPISTSAVLIAAIAFLGSVIRHAAKTGDWSREKEAAVHAWAADCLERLPFVSDAEDG